MVSLSPVSFFIIFVIVLSLCDGHLARCTGSGIDGETRRSTDIHHRDRHVIINDDATKQDNVALNTDRIAAAANSNENKLSGIPLPSNEMPRNNGRNPSPRVKRNARQSPAQVVFQSTVSLNATQLIAKASDEQSTCLNITDNANTLPSNWRYRVKQFGQNASPSCVSEVECLSDESINCVAITIVYPYFITQSLHNGLVLLNPANDTVTVGCTCSDYPRTTPAERVTPTDTE